MDPLFLDQLAEHHYATADDFFSRELYTGLRAYFDDLVEADRLRRAGVGAMSQYTVNKTVRGDHIFWIKEEDQNAALNMFRAEMKAIQETLSREFFLSLSDSEFHFARYPPGTFYRRHLDQFKDRNNRQITVLLYFNDQWKPGDGGELRIFTKGGQLDIAPLGNRFLVFKSDTIEHEVLPTNTYRNSLTGWLLNNPAGLGFLG